MPREGRIVVTRKQVFSIGLIAAAFLGAGAQPSFGADGTASGTTGAQLTSGTTGAQLASGTTGAQQSTTCPTPKLKGLPKRPKFTNATIHYTITGLTTGATYLVKAGRAEVGAGAATSSTATGSFLLPDQGTVDKKIVIAAIIQMDNCENAPWKVEKRIPYKAVNPPVTATPAAPAPGTPAAAPVTPVKPVVPVTPIKPLKLPKPITQRLPSTGPPPSRLSWLTPIDGGARLDQRLTGPQLSRLERKADKAQSSSALFGLGIVALLFAVATIGGFMAFRRRDEIQFERAMTEQLKHLEEGDPGMEFAEDPDSGSMFSIQEAPFAARAAPDGTEPVPANGAAALAPHRAAVEAELQRVLNEAGLEAGLEGILTDARAEAERNGIALDPEVMLETLCDEINGSAKLSDPKRAELRSMFADIIAEVAEEGRRVPAEAEKVPTP
jgi:hypothetical protein